MLRCWLSATVREPLESYKRAPKGDKPWRAWSSGSLYTQGDFEYMLFIEPVSRCIHSQTAARQDQLTYSHRSEPTSSGRPYRFPVQNLQQNFDTSALRIELHIDSCGDLDFVVDADVVFVVVVGALGAVEGAAGVVEMALVVEGTAAVVLAIPRLSQKFLFAFFVVQDG